MTYPEHIQWIIDNRGEDLAKALSQDNSYETIDNPLDVILSADPTDKKKLTQWLVDTYIKDGFRWEDIQSGSKSKVFDTLSLYIKHKSKLDSTNHIGQYDTLGSVYKDITPFIKSDKSSRSVKRDDQAKAYEESDMLIKSDSLTVVIPKTEYASKWWGKGTQWCTAGDKDNMFYDYYNNGPLIIIIINGVKTQLFIDFIDNSNDIQFMDEHDVAIKQSFINENWILLKDIIYWALSYNGYALGYIPKNLNTEKLFLIAVRNNGNSLAYVPESLRTAELCLEAVRKNGYALRYVPESLRTPDLYLEAVRQNGRALRHIYGYLRTVELCLESVRQNGQALYDVPHHLRTAELCLEAVRQNGHALAYVPEPLRTAEICLGAIRQIGDSLRYAPESLRKAYLCLEAVRKDGYSLNHTPESLKTKELCLEAVKQSGCALLFVPETLRVAELCLEAVKQNGRALEYVPKPLRTAELCLEAVKQNGIFLFSVPVPLRTAELCLEAIKQNTLSLKYVPENLINEEILLYCKNSNVGKGVEIKWDFSRIDELKLQLEYGNKLNPN